MRLHQRVMNMSSSNAQFYNYWNKSLASFQYANRATHLSHARESVLRWWWEYLRLSKDYWLLCRTCASRRPETTDKRLARVFNSFGNIHEENFDKWWVNTGYLLFAEVDGPAEVRLHLPGRPLIPQNNWGSLLVEIPLSLSKKTITKRIHEILKEHEEQRPDSWLAASKAEFPVNPVRFRVPTLKTTHKLYCLHHNLIVRPRLTHGEDYEVPDIFHIGKLSGACHGNIHLGDNATRNAMLKNRVRATVGRYIARANLLIQNVEIGTFPVFKPVEVQKRFTVKQVKHFKTYEEEWLSLKLGSELNSKK
jgi:hypothetical protein